MAIRLWDESREELKDIPEHMRGGLCRYINHGIRPGSFLEAVICNDLREACARADHINRNRLFDFVAFLYQHAPGTSWGSHDAYDQWVDARGLDGINATVLNDDKA